jgi:hypothetical protein
VTQVRKLLGAIGILSVLGFGSTQPGAQTVYRNVSGPITAFAADGLTGVEVTLPKPGTRNVTCRWSVGGGPVGLAVAEKEGGALWTLNEQAQVDLDYVVGATAAEPRERRFDQVAHTLAGAGLWLGGVAGSGSTLVYAVTTVAYVDQVACLSGGSCQLKIAGGAIHLVTGRRNPVLPDTGPAVAVAVSDGRLAYIPARGIGAGGLPLASASVPIPVRSAQTGAIVTRIAPRGLPIGLALAPDVLVLLVRRSNRTSIAWYDPVHGTQLGSVRVPDSTSPRLAVSDRIIVYSVGKVLHAIDVADGLARQLLAAPVAPVGLSITGGRVLWAENLDGRGRVRSLAVG